MSSFQPETDSFQPDQQQTPDQGFHPADMLMNLYQNSVKPVVEAGKQVYGYPLEKVAEAGRLSNQGNQQLAQNMAEGGGYLQGRYGIPGAGMVGALAGTALGTISQAILPQTKLGVAATMLGAANDLGLGGQELSEMTQGTSKPGAIAQTMQATAKIPANQAQYALDHPEILGSDTPSVAQATKEYADAVPGLKGKVADLAQQLNKTVIRNSDYDFAIDRAGRLLNGTEVKEGSEIADKLTPQDALTGLQSINQALRNKAYTAGMSKEQIGQISKVKDGLLDFLQNNGAPKLREAGKTLFEAHVKEALSDWLPKNKFGSTDALRTIVGLSEVGKAGALALSGNPVAAAPLAAGAAAMSPKMWGLGIKTAGQMALPGQGMIGQAAGAAAPYIPNMLSNVEQQ